jgi:Recombination enhancement, RecA-dependent nuclease
MKGRNVTAQQKRWHDMLVQSVGCVACRVGCDEFNDQCSIHHVDGRTKPHAHWYVLPLCAGHHQHGYGPEGFTGFAVHGQKVHFEEAYGTQSELMNFCAKFAAEAGHDVPAGFLAWVDGSEIEA